MKSQKKAQLTAAETRNSDQAQGQSVKIAPKLSIRQLVLAGVCLVLLFVVATWYVGAKYLAKFSVGPATYSARLSDQELTEQIDSSLQDFRLQIAYPDGRIESFSPAEMGISLNKYSTLANLRKSGTGVGAQIAWWQPTSAHVATTLDKDKFDSFVAKHAMIVTKPAQEGALAIVDGSVQTTEAVSGWQYGLEDPDENIQKAVERMQPVTLRIAPRPLEPVISNEAVQSAKAKAESMLSQKIELEIDDRIIKPPPVEVGQWIVISPDTKSKRINVSIDNAKVLAYLQLIAQENSREAQDQVVRGGVVSEAGVRGVTVSATQEMATQIAESLTNGSGAKVAMSVQHQDFKTVESTVPNYGQKWIDVDLSAKRMYAYSQDSLVNTFLISAGASGTPTVTGRFAIYAKYAQQDMRGPNTDGTRYYQPDVPWVNYFYQDYAIHGNYWRPTSYFGNVHSSHGCVGVLVDEARWLYDWAPIGTPVVVHW